MVETKTYSKIKCLRSNNGGEFTLQEFMDLSGEIGIKIQFSTARRPQQDGVAERKNIIVHEISKTMLKYSKLGAIFWA
jgi:transposase InsO family protein